MTHVLVVLLLSSAHVKSSFNRCSLQYLVSSHRLAVTPVSVALLHCRLWSS